MSKTQCQRTPSPAASEVRSEPRTPEKKQTLSIKCPPTPRQQPTYKPHRSKSVSITEERAVEGIRQNSKKRRASVSVQETVDHFGRLELEDGLDDATPSSKKPRVAESSLGDQSRDRHRLARQEHLRLLSASDEDKVEILEILIQQKRLEIADIRRRALFRMERMETQKALLTYGAQVAADIQERAVAIERLTAIREDPDSILSF